MAALMATAALLLFAAWAVLPFDDNLSYSMRMLGRAGGKRSLLQEALSLIRPFGKGIVAAFIALVLGVCGGRRRALQILLALALTSVLVWPLKIGVGRERPNWANNHSFPSGDTATAVAFCTPFLGATPWGVPAALAVGGGVAAGRVIDGRHFPTDVLAGAAMGLIAGAAAVRLLRRTSWLPARAWFLVGALFVAAFAFSQLPSSRAIPDLLAFLVTWGPAGIFLVAVRWLPGWLGSRRRHSTTTPETPRRFRLALMGVCLAALAVYMFVSASSTLWDRDEPRFSRATVEMVRSGNYLYPTFNSSLRPDKPILLYWLMAIPVSLLGVAEWTCRLIAPLATVVTAWLTARIARRLAGETAGWLAALFVVTSPLMLVSGTAATTDALLLAWIVATLSLFSASCFNGFRPAQALLMGFTLAGALLTKGPVGLAVPLLIIAVALAVLRKSLPFPIRSYVLWLALAVVIGILLFLAWALPANAATDGEFLRRGVGHHVVDRSLTPLESHGGKSLLFSLYYVPIILFAFFPWTLYLPAALAQARSGTAIRYLLCWTLPILLLMSVVATKLPHYVLPIWPALSILAAIGLVTAMRTPRELSASRAGRTGLWIFAPVGAALGLTLMIAPWFTPVFGIRVPATNMGVVLLGMTLAGTSFFLRGRHDAVAAILAAGMTVIVLTAALRLLPAIETVKIAPRLAEAVNRSIPMSVPVATCGFGEPTLNFYLDRGRIEDVPEGSLAQRLSKPDRKVFIISESVARRSGISPQRHGLRELAMIEGFNYSRGRWMKVYAFLKEPAP